jgi:hypothetical protein
MTEGLEHGRYGVTRRDGRHLPGEKHYGCSYFVLDLAHDPAAIPALIAYANAVRVTEPALAADLDALVPDLMARFDFRPNDEAATHPIIDQEQPA